MWDPFKEKSESWKLFIQFLEQNFFSILVALTINVIVIVIFWGWYIDRTTNTIPYSVMLEKVDQLTIPQYFELRPIPKEYIKEAIPAIPAYKRGK